MSQHISKLVKYRLLRCSFEKGNTMHANRKTAWHVVSYGLIISELVQGRDWCQIANIIWCQLYNNCFKWPYQIIFKYVSFFNYCFNGKCMYKQIDSSFLNRCRCPMTTSLRLSLNILKIFPRPLHISALLMLHQSEPKTPIEKYSVRVIL